MRQLAEWGALANVQPPIAAAKLQQTLRRDGLARVGCTFLAATIAPVPRMLCVWHEAPVQFGGSHAGGEHVDALRSMRLGTPRINPFTSTLQIAPVLVRIRARVGRFGKKRRSIDAPRIARSDGAKGTEYDESRCHLDRATRRSGRKPRRPPRG